MPHTSSAYKTRMMHGWRQDTHTPPTLLCLQDLHEAWSPVRDTHTPHSPLPTRPAWSIVAGQRHTYPTLPLPTRPAWSMVETHTLHTPQSETHTPHTNHLQDPVTHPTLSAYKAWSTTWEMHTTHFNHGYKCTFVQVHLLVLLSATHLKLLGI